MTLRDGVKFPGDLPVDALWRWWFAFKNMLAAARCRACHLPSTAWLCAHCLKRLGYTPRQLWHDPPVWVLSTLTPESRALIYGCKFHGNHRDPGTLLRLALLGVDAALHELMPAVGCADGTWVITPPGHHPPARNGLPWLASRLAAWHNWHYVPNALQWVRHTEPQHGLQNRQARLANVVNAMAFAVPPDHPPPKHLLIVDDLLTTGATMRESVRAVREGTKTLAQPVGITGLALARVPLKPPAEPHQPDATPLTAGSEGALALR